MLFNENNKRFTRLVSDGSKIFTCIKKTINLKWLALLFLGGCEADLNLQGVQQEQEKSTIRTDQYQEMVVNNGVITLVGSQGLVMLSEDQGVSWQRHMVEKTNFIGVTACPNNTLIALSFDRHIWISSDHGKQWNKQALPTREDVMDISCAPDGSYWITASFSTLLHSRDQGNSWQESTFDEDALLTHIEFFDNNTGIVAGEFGLFYKTTDGGESWNSVGVIGEELYPLAIHFSNPDTGWAGGLSGVIMQTSDGGASWSAQQTQSKSPVYSFVSSGSDLYAIGDHGSIQTLQKGRWTRLQSPKIPVYLSTGHIFDSKELLVAGGWGALFTVPLEMTVTVNN